MFLDKYIGFFILSKRTVYKLIILVGLSYANLCK